MIQALEAVDSYLDGNILSSKAHDTVEELYERIKEYEPEDFSEKTNYILISSSILLIKTELSSIAFEGETSTKITEKRNDLAEKIGEKKR